MKMPNLWCLSALVFISLVSHATAATYRTSELTCEGSEYAIRTCILSNVVVWNKKVYFISEDSDTSLPPMRLHTFHKLEMDEKDKQVQDFVEVVKPTSLPFSGAANATSYAAGAAVVRTHTGNWFHSFSEDGGNWATRICKTLKICTYSDFHAQNFLLLFLDAAPPATGNYGDFHLCFGEPLILKDTNADDARVVDRLLVGVGDECNARHCHQWSIITLPQVASMLQLSKNVSVPGARFSLVYLEGMTWREAAALFNDADVVVVPHGAQSSNVVFMPMQSQAVHVANDEAHANGTASVMTEAGKYIELQEQGLIVSPLNETFVDVDKAVKEYGGLDSWSKEDFGVLIGKHWCPHSTHASCPDFNIFSRVLHYSPAATVLKAEVLDH
ncbi:hypothetical protein WJX73_010204 [Symbiochloris irregularis]|uniref:Glycosyltransferase 61 catalytic domain-containing protein n=1 Tax=Symbiochloris irregularis TaxID=706552 RepID=A0AAW1NQJ8_9CHLO